MIIADVGPDQFHVGDEAMLEANVEALRRFCPSARIAVLGREASDDGTLSDALKTADGLFISGGGNLRSPFSELLGQRVRALREARRLGVPVVTGGQTIGPDLTAVERAALVDAFAGIRHLGVRETASLAFALEMGIPQERISYQVDDAFLLARRRPDASIARAAGEPFVAVTFDPSFVAQNASDELEKLAAQLAIIALETGLHIVFVPHVGPLGEIGSEDGRVGRALEEQLRGAGVPCTVLPVMSSAETVWITQRAAAVVSSRYHPLVFGMGAAVPSLGIHRDAYTRVKVEGALAHAGMASWSQSSNTAAAGGLIAAFRRLWGEREAVRTAIARARAPVDASEELRWQSLLAALDLPQPYAEKTQPPVFPSLLGWRRNGTTTLKRTSVVTEQQWTQYARDGFLPLGEVIDAPMLAALRQRADDLATGRVSNADVQMQLDTGGPYEGLPGLVSSALGTLRYRTIVGLETDDRFAPLVRHPLFMEIAAHHYGKHAPVSVFRAIVMNKPARLGTVLPWHQDGGDVWALDRDPLVTIWVALDSATSENGCVEVVAGSHRFGLLSRHGSTLSDENAARYCAPERIVPLELEAGHGVLLHNWLIHRSGVNHVHRPRRAFSVCYMDARTISTLTGARFPIVAGSLPPEPYPFLREMERDANGLRAQSVAAVEYATSLRESNALLEQSVDDATSYARSLQDDMDALRAESAAAVEYSESLKDANAALQRSVHDATGYARDLEAQLKRVIAMRDEAERYARSLEATRAAGVPAKRLRSVS